MFSANAYKYPIFHLFMHLIFQIVHSLGKRWGYFYRTANGVWQPCFWWAIRGGNHPPETPFRMGGEWDACTTTKRLPYSQRNYQCLYTGHCVGCVSTAMARHSALPCINGTSVISGVWSILVVREYVVRAVKSMSYTALVTTGCCSSLAHR